MSDVVVNGAKPACRFEPETAAALTVIGLDHVVLRVADLPRAVAFYQGVLGCRVERELDTPRLVQMRAGSAMIDLVPIEAHSPEHHRVAGSENMDHFAVRVAAFDPTVLTAHLRAQGVAVGDIKRRYGAEGYGPSLYVTDPDGNVVELKGPPESD